MTRYSTLFTALLAVCAVVFVAPQTAGAGCPGCEEYTLDIPDDGGGGGGDPAAAPAPTAPAPTAVPTAPTATVPTETVPVAPTGVVSEEKPKPKPVDTDPDPVPGGAAVKPVSLEGLPSIAATEAAQATDAGTDGGILPLAIALGAVGLVGLALGLRNHGRSPDG